MIGREIVFRGRVESTQDEVRGAGATGAAEGFAVVADSQSSGRGRKGNRWHSPPGTGLYVSFLLRPPAHAVTLLSLALGLSTSQAVESVCGIETELKWPNDLIIGGKKAAGIIAESQVQDERVLYVVAGIGINVSEPAGGWPREVADIATALPEGTSREALLAELFNAAEINYDHLRRGAGSRVLDEYRRRCPYRRGAPVIVGGWQAGAEEEAVAIEVAEDGGLLVERKGGIRETLYGHEVRMQVRHAW